MAFSISVSVWPEVGASTHWPAPVARLVEHADVEAVGAQPRVEDVDGGLEPLVGLLGVHIPVGDDHPAEGVGRGQRHEGQGVQRGAAQRKALTPMPAGAPRPDRAAGARRPRLSRPPPLSCETKPASAARCLAAAGGGRGEGRRPVRAARRSRRDEARRHDEGRRPTKTCHNHSAPTAGSGHDPCAHSVDAGRRRASSSPHPAGRGGSLYQWPSYGGTAFVALGPQGCKTRSRR